MPGFRTVGSGAVARRQRVGQCRRLDGPAGWRVRRQTTVVKRSGRMVNRLSHVPRRGFSPQTASIHVAGCDARLARSWFEIADSKQWRLSAGVVRCPAPAGAPPPPGVVPSLKLEVAAGGRARGPGAIKLEIPTTGSSSYATTANAAPRPAARRAARLRARQPRRRLHNCRARCCSLASPSACRSRRRCCCSRRRRACSSPRSCCGRCR